MQPDEPQLVDRSRDGDLSAFNAIVERYQSQVYNVSARILGDRHLAEDIAQETFIKAHRSIDGFRGGSLRAWLLRIASNLSLDATRSRKRRPGGVPRSRERTSRLLRPFGQPRPRAGPCRASCARRYRTASCRFLTISAPSSCWSTYRACPTTRPPMRLAARSAP